MKAWKAESFAKSRHVDFIGSGDHSRPERLLRYKVRPPVCAERLALRDDRKVHYAFKSAWRDGTKAVVLSGLDFISRLCALIPPLRFHLEISVCPVPGCKGEMRLKDVASKPDHIGRVLAELGLAPRPPTRTGRIPARQLAIPSTF